MPPTTPPTPLLGQFLVALNGFISVRNGSDLSSYLALEPPFAKTYTALITELRNTYPSGSESALESKCSSSLPAAREGADGSPWLPFVKFVAQYLVYLRDVDPDPRRYLRTYEALAELQLRGNSALNHPVLGYLLLPVVVANAKLVCRLAIGLDKQPDLLRAQGSGRTGGGGGEESGSRETLPEKAANTLRNAFVTCLNDRSVSGIDSQGRPEGKKKGIYTIANLCLKILFQCRKTRNATQIFENIYNLSPPLAAYPRAERVTYLYYLGRFYFQNSHFCRAQQVLQAAYDESPTHDACVPQRRKILLYLITSNLLLGRFPSTDLLSRPEAQGLAARFLPLCAAIRKGDLASYRRHLSFGSEHASWFLQTRLLLPLQNRGEVLVWRSLVRKVWVLKGTRPDPETRLAPTVDVLDLVSAFAYFERRSRTPRDEIPDPDFAGLSPDPATELLPLRDAVGIESLLSSLIDQGLLSGYLSRARLRFAITGVKGKGGDVLAAGFPRPWEVMKARAEREGLGGEVPGWKKASTGGMEGGVGFGGRVGPGMVFNLSGARPVGAA